MIAACGIDCSVCDIHLAPSNPEIAERMVKVFVNMGYKDAKPEWFHCEGCSGDRNAHWSSNCEMMYVALTKSIFKIVANAMSLCVRKLKNLLTMDINIIKKVLSA